MKIAIVTGASSGLGMAFVRRLDALGGLDEISGCGPPGERMEALAAELRTPMRPLALDSDPIGERGDPAGSHERGGAGGGGAGQRRRVRQIRHLRRTHPPGDLRHDRPELPGCRRTHCRRAPLHGAGKPGAGDLCSSAAFQPLPGFNVYAATKAFLSGYSRALRWEAAPRGIRVTAVCPGWIRTDFMDVAKDTKNGRTVRSFPFAQRPETVARRALRNSRLLAVTTCGLPALVAARGQQVPAPLLHHGLLGGPAKGMIQSARNQTAPGAAFIYAAGSSGSRRHPVPRPPSASADRSRRTGG